MTKQFHFSIPISSSDQMSFAIDVGETLYVLGANGTGKSSLITRLYRPNAAFAKRISAHRQTWFESNTIDMTPRSREELESNVRTQDTQPNARYRDWNPAARAIMAIYDLIDADTMQERKIAALVRNGDMETAKQQANSPSPIQVINRLMRLSNIPIEISVDAGQKILASKNGGAGYSVAEMSDGERNAFLIAAEVLTAKPDTLILIDEPERHLHRSIVAPLLKLLFDHRSDCAFVVSTHELMLPVDTPKASTLLVRGCEYSGKNVQSWTADLLAPGSLIDDDLKCDLLGSRRKIIFVEGTSQSIDHPLYSLLFPQVSIVPKENCREVEQAVRGLRNATDLHWVSVWGIIDKDQRTAADIDRLKNAGVFALTHYSVEAFYYHPSIIRLIAERQAALTGDNANTLLQTAISLGIEAAKSQREHLVESAILRATRNAIFDRLPNRNDIAAKSTINIEVDLTALRMSEVERFDALIKAKDWDGLLTRYPLRESSAFKQVVDGLKVKNQSIYRASILKLLQDDPSAVEELRTLMGNLYAEVSD